MSNRIVPPMTISTTLSRCLALGGAVAVFSLTMGHALPGHAAGVESSRANGQPAQIAITGTGATRQCWARYSMNGAQPRNGQIEETAFRVPCPELMTTDFIATLQRALAARSYYDGPITGRADPATRRAVQAFQRAQGFDSPILTLETAQKLGLVPAIVAQR